MRNTSFAIVSLLVVFGAACNQSKKATPEAALNRAYQAGIVSKSEYEAKIAALRPPTAAPIAPPVPVAAPAADLPPAAPAPAAPVAPAAPINRPAKAARVVKPAERVAFPESPAQPVEAPRPVVAAVTPKRNRPAPAAAPSHNDDTARGSARPPACGETETRPGKEKGEQERFFPMPIAAVRAAAIKALKDLDFSVHKASENEIEASKKRHIGMVIGSGGERMTLRLEEVTEGNQRGTRVIGETKKGLIMRVGQKSWTNAVLDETACMLHTSGRVTGPARRTGAALSEY